MGHDERVHDAELEERLAALEAARVWSPRVVSRLEARIREGSDLELFRVNPKSYATAQSIDRTEAIELFLHAAHIGLFAMEWNLVCASCGNTARSFRSLARVDPHFVCETCQMVNRPSLDEFVQVTFTVSPSVRDISYHEPESLTAEDRYFNYQMSRDVRSTSGNLTSIRDLRASTYHVGYLAPGASATVELDFTDECLVVRDILHAASLLYLPEGPGPAPDAPTAVRLTLDSDGFHDQDRRLEAWEYVLTERVEMRVLFPAMARSSPGPLSLTIRNELGERAALWVVGYPRIPRVFEPIEFEPILSAREVLSTQTFRRLFRSESIAASETLEIRDLTFLFTDLRDSTAMYERIGDVSAYNLVRLHFDLLEVVIDAHRGAIVKTIGDAVMATFVEPADGVRAALAMAARLAEFDARADADLELKMGIHRGPALAIGSNDAVDYFGQTVNIAARVQGLARPGELCLSEDVYRASGVAQALGEATVASETGAVKGVSETLTVYRAGL